MKVFSSPTGCHGSYLKRHIGRENYMPTSIDVFAKAREHERIEQLKAARELDALPYFRVLEGPTLPTVEMEGQARIMLGSNNYLGLTGDERVKQGALDALHSVRHRPHRIALPQRDDRPAPRARARARRVARHRGRDRVHNRPPGERGRVGDDSRPERHCDSGLRRPRLDPRRVHPLAREAATVPPQPAGPARARARARRLGRRWRPGRRGRRVLDGGRRRAACRRSPTCARATAPA